MIKRQRIFSFFLAALLTGSAMLSCSSPEVQETAAETAAEAETVSGETEEAEETEEPRLDSGLPGSDLNGYEITFFGKEVSGVLEEETTGDVVVDAIYNRNLLLESTYNFKIAEVLASNQEYAITEALQTVYAGDDSYQVLMDGGNRFVEFIQQGMMHDMNTLTYQDFTKPWWYKNLNDGVSLKNKLFMSVAAFMLTSYTQVYHPIVNADIALDLGVDKADLYQSVRDGKWTIDEFAKLCQIGSRDLNGDGVMDHQDQWGFQTQAYSGYALALGCGYRIADKDESDLPYISVATDNSIDLWDKLCSLIFSQKDVFLATQNITGVESTWTAASTITNEGRALVAFGSLSAGMRDLEYDYAVLPAPKRDEQQEFYYHTGSSWNTPMLGVPTSVQALDNVSFILEAMAYESYYSVLPDFYSNYLETKLVRDEDSIEMLEIIHSSMFYDAGAVYNWGAFLGAAYDVVTSGTNNLVTVAASKNALATKEIQRMLDKIGD